jgi:ornithine cyclodeaminase/alanine dehydrogenase-like protein (mu-crystallin family)
VTLYLTEEDVTALLTIEDALEAVEGSFRRLAAGHVQNRPRDRLRLEGGLLAVMAAADLELGYAGLKTYTAFGYDDIRFVVLLFETDRADLAGVVEANRLGQLRTGAASGVAARYLARPGARTLGVIGCGWQAETQVAAIRAAVPTLERVVAYCRTPERLRSFCERVGAEPAESQREAGDLIEPVEQGVLDWLEVHELQEVVAGETPGRSSDEDIVLFKSNGIAAWDLAIGAVALSRARERGVGKPL